jgi:hypothetical protein
VHQCYDGRWVEHGKYSGERYECISANEYQVDLSTLNTFQQVVLFILLLLGSNILISSTVLVVRKRAFEAKLKDVSDSREASRRASALELQNLGQYSLGESLSSNVNGQMHLKIAATVQETPAQSSAIDEPVQWTDDDQVTMNDEQRHHHHHRVFHMVGVGARPDLNNHPRDLTPLPFFNDEPLGFGLRSFVRGTQKYFSSKGLVSRNSQFHGLSSVERKELGGVEYKAVSFLSWIVSLYYITFILLGIIGVGGWLQANHPEVTRENGLDPFWTGAFFAVSAFVNSGMSLLDKNMTALQLQ